MQVKTNKVGAPTKYKPIYCQAIVDYFDIPPSQFRDITVTHKDGTQIDKTEEEASPLPTFRKFAKSIGVYHDTLLSWCQRWPDFLTAYNRAKEAQKEFIIENALRDNYSGYFAGLMMKNMFGWRDKEEDKPPVDNSTHYHFNRLQGEKLVAEAKRRNIPVPEILARRFGSA